MKNVVKFTLYWASLLSASMVSASGPSYYADLQRSEWEVTGSIFECRLSQEIPLYGEAVFYRQAGMPVLFTLTTSESEMAAGKALLTSAAPQWKQGVLDKDIAYIDVAEGERPVNLDSKHTRLVLAELVSGMMPTVVRHAWYNEDAAITVAVSPAKFTAAYEQYQDCVADLLPVNFSQVERNTIPWRSGQEELDQDTKRLLDNIVAYAKGDLSVNSIQINGFTDTVGTAAQNLELSRERAFMVHSYLVSKGIDEAMIETRYFGETEEYLLVPNERTAADRNRNRRVTVLLRRD
ncbi:MAG: OmpA family protein [Pseudohongiellaceae bacterium]|nr:OmpA family protein [Pseudohongiellaceae bacterium]